MAQVSGEPASRKLTFHLRGCLLQLAQSPTNDESWETMPNRLLLWSKITGGRQKKFLPCAAGYSAGSHLSAQSSLARLLAGALLLQHRVLGTSLARLVQQPLHETPVCVSVSQRSPSATVAFRAHHAGSVLLRGSPIPSRLRERTNEHPRIRPCG